MSEDKTLTLKSLKKETDASVQHIEEELLMIRERLDAVESAIEKTVGPSVKAMEAYAKSSDLRNTSRITALESRVKRAEEKIRVGNSQRKTCVEMSKELSKASLMSAIAITVSVVSILVAVACTFGGMF